MKLLILGGGEVTSYLVSTLEKEHEITIIENDPVTAKEAANRLDAIVVFGDGSSLEVLASAGCHDADMLVAITGRDEDNLVACMAAKKYFRVPMTMARISNPRNFSVMQLFYVDRVYSGTKILAEMIEQDIDFPGMRIVHRIPESDRLICEFMLPEKSPACGKTLLEYDFVKDSRVVLITTSDGDAVTPVGSTVMRKGDTILMVCPKKYMEAIWKDMVCS